MADGKDAEDAAAAVKAMSCLCLPAILVQTKAISYYEKEVSAFIREIDSERSMNYEQSRTELSF